MKKYTFPWTHVALDSPDSGKLERFTNGLSEIPTMGCYKTALNKNTDPIRSLIASVEYIGSRGMWHAYIYLSDDDMCLRTGLQERSGFFDGKLHAVTYVDYQLKRLGYREYKQKHLVML